MKPKTIVLLSGGMDSVSVLYDVTRSHEVVATLSFDYGSKHNPKELPFAQWHSERLGVRNHVVILGFMGELFSSDLLRSGGDIPDGHYEEVSMQKTVVPFRNGIMLSIAGGLAESVGACLFRRAEFRTWVPFLVGNAKPDGNQEPTLTVNRRNY